MLGFEDATQDDIIPGAPPPPKLNNRRRFGDVRKNGIVYRHVKPPSPGAQSYVYSTLSLPEFSPIGSATMNRSQFRTVAPLVMQFQAVPVQGLGGLQQGQVIMAPLINESM